MLGELDEFGIDGIGELCVKSCMSSKSEFKIYV